MLGGSGDGGSDCDIALDDGIVTGAAGVLGEEVEHVVTSGNGEGGGVRDGGDGDDSGVVVDGDCGS